MPRLTVPRFLLAAASLLTLTGAIPTITTKGSKFFTSDGDQWYIKGAAYQLLPNDPLIDTAQCKLDAALMKELGANAIRVYHVAASADHDGCMAAFSAAGIYTFIDLDTFDDYIIEGTPTWTSAQFGAYRYVVDAFHKYDNVAGFFIGNEIINQVGPATAAAPYIKAATADLKAYIKAQGYRDIPVGYSHADVAGLRPVLQDYFVCGDDDAQSIDFFGLNCYEWCGSSTYETSGYSILQNQTAGYPVPIFMSETGCNQPEPRLFGDQAAIFGPMVDTWSGSIIYEWIQEENHYGIITYNSDNTNALDYDAPAGGFSVSGTPKPVTPDFNNLKTQWATLTPTGVAKAAYTTTYTRPSCPAYTAGVWEVSGNVPLPTLGVSVAIPTSTALSMANFDYSGTLLVPGAAAVNTGSAAAASSSASASASSSSASVSSSSKAAASSSSASASSSSASASSSSASASSSFASASSASATDSSSSGTATATTTTEEASTSTAAAASATSSGASVLSKEVKGTAVGLSAVLLGFFWFM